MQLADDLLNECQLPHNAQGYDELATMLQDALRAVRAKAGQEARRTAGNPTKRELMLVFGRAGLRMNWRRRTREFGISPENFQTALAEKQAEARVVCIDEAKIAAALRKPSAFIN